jgi:hypothetical protein
MVLIMTEWVVCVTAGEPCITYLQMLHKKLHDSLHKLQKFSALAKHCRDSANATLMRQCCLGMVLLWEDSPWLLMRTFPNSTNVALGVVGMTQGSDDL